MGSTAQLHLRDRDFRFAFPRNRGRSRQAARLRHRRTRSSSGMNDLADETAHSGLSEAGLLPGRLEPNRHILCIAAGWGSFGSGYTTGQSGVRHDGVCRLRYYRCHEYNSSRGLPGRHRGTDPRNRFAVAMFSEQARPAALATIMFEWEFAAMLEKSLMIVKSRTVAAPSGLTRTDWIEYDPQD